MQKKISKREAVSVLHRTMESLYDSRGLITSLSMNDNWNLEATENLLTRWR